MGLILCLLGFASVAWMARRNTGDGLGLLLAIGSIYGIARCRLFDGYTHFLFDASVLGAYFGLYPRIVSMDLEGLTRLKKWMVALAAVPFVLILLSPFIDAQPVLVQLLGLRPALFFLPFLLVGGVLEPADARRLAGWAVGVALGTAGIALAEYVYGVELFFPVNDASRIIYMSRDIGESRAIRIPATFSSAHAYGGTMVALVPLLVLLLDARKLWIRSLAVVALCAAALGVFACAARLPFIGLLIVFSAVVFRGVRRPAIRAGGLVVIGLVMLTVPQDERLQRFETLSDSGYVSSRVKGSVNASLLETLSENPLGRGLGSAVGTSIPYFLAAEAKPQVGLENEFARIAVEQGLLGVILWLAFGSWALLRSPRGLARFGGIADLGMWAFCLYNWAGGFVGTGFLASVPGTMILMIYMGVVVSIERGAPVAPLRGFAVGQLTHHQSA